MDLTAHFRRMARNNAWSNWRLFDACGRLSRDDYAAPRTGYFPSIQRTMDHILMVDLYYLDALEGSRRGFNLIARWQPITEFAAVRMDQIASDQRLIGFCDRLTPDEPNREIVVDRGPNGLTRESVGDTLAHLFVHQVHHRGQVHAMLAGSLAGAPQLDEYFLRFDAGRRAEDLAALGIEGPEAIC